MNSEDITQALANYCLRERNAALCTANIFAYYPNECDVLAIWDSGFATDYEIKVSRSDFKADFKKAKHRKMERNQVAGANQFYFVVPADLVTKEEVPDYAGLIYVSEGRQGILHLTTIKRAPKRHKQKVSEKVVRRMARSICFKFFSDNTPAANGWKRKYGDLLHEVGKINGEH